MLMAAVTSTSLITETTSIRSAVPGHTESTGGSFVDSLVENTVLAEVMPSDAGSQTKPLIAAETNSLIPGKTPSATISAADTEVRSVIGIVGKLQNGAENVKSSASLGTGKANGIVANKTNLSVTGAALQSDEAAGKPDVVSQATISDGLPSPLAPGAGKNLEQTLLHDDTDGAERTDPQIATPVPVAGTDGILKQVLTAKNAILVSDDAQIENSAGTVAKEHATSGKTEKTAKAEAKQEKKDKAGVTVGATAVDVQATALVQVFVNPTGAQQSAAGDAEPDVSASTPATGFSRNVGTTLATNGKNNRAAPNAAKQEDNSVKAAGSSIEIPLSQKAEPDATKPELLIASSPDTDKSKLQSTVASAADTGQLRTVSVASAQAPALISGGGATHNAGMGLHMTEAISHAAASAQPGPNFIETISSVDAAHKTLSATPTSLEVGVANGTHGWLKIRAEMADGGAVNTSLSTSSVAGQEMLHRELPSLAAYLKSEHVTVNAVVVQPMPANSPDTRGSFAGANGSAHGQAQQSGNQGRENQQNPTLAPASTSVSYSSLGAMGEEEIFSSTSHVQGGGWLSVRA